MLKMTTRLRSNATWCDPTRQTPINGRCKTFRSHGKNQSCHFPPKSSGNIDEQRVIERCRDDGGISRRLLLFSLSLVSSGRGMTPATAAPKPPHLDTISYSYSSNLMHGMARERGAIEVEQLAEAKIGNIPPAVIQLENAPDQSLYPRDDPRLLKAAKMVQSTLNAENVDEEEKGWTSIIEEFGDLDEVWAKDVVSRAWGNRGNARSRQGRLEEAIGDYNKSIELSPWSVDPVLNRGVVLESLGDFEGAMRDYKAVLRVAPNDPSAWNNLGNAEAGLGNWQAASENYGRAYRIAPQFAFAAANQALAEYQLGHDEEAERAMRNLLRKFPGFDDMRAALAAVLWARGMEAEAENELLRVEDTRYKDTTWIKYNRRWPPRLQSDISSLLKIS